MHHQISFPSVLRSHRRLPATSVAPRLDCRATAASYLADICHLTAMNCAGSEDFKPPQINPFMSHGWTLGKLSSNSNGNGNASSGDQLSTHSASMPTTGPMAIPQRPLPPLPPSMLSLNGHSPGTVSSPCRCIPHLAAVGGVSGWGASKCRWEMRVLQNSKVLIQGFN